MPQITTHFDLSTAWRTFIVATAAALAGCEGSVTVDMGTQTTADPLIDSVWVDIEGIELQGDGTETLTFDEPERVNLTQFVEGNLFRLFTDEQLPDGRYTGVRLLISTDDDNDDFVTWNGRQFDLNVEEGRAADVSFSVDKDESTEEDVILTLDLRQSLRFVEDSGTDSYTLTPVLRGVRGEDAGRVAGNVTSSCPSGTSLIQGGAVYLFNAHDRTPDDRDGADEEPYLTTRVFVGASNAIPTYSFQFVPDGDYTLALTCDGDEDDPAANDGLRFQNTTNIRVQAEETLTQNLD